MRPMRSRSRRGRRPAGPPRPAGSSSSPITGGPPTKRPARCMPPSRPATPRGPSTPMPRPGASTSGRSSCGTPWRPTTGRTDRDLGDLYDDASATATLVGDGSRAVSLAQRAIELVDAAPGADLDRERRARARERLGFAAWLAGDTATSIQLLEEAVALLDGTPPSTAQSRVLAGLAANLMLAGRSSDSIPVAERAIEHARTTGDRGIESRATGVLGVDRAYLGDIAGGIELLRRSLAMASPADDPLAVPRAYANLGSVLEMGGFVDEALEVSLAGAREHPGLRQRAQLPHIPRGQRSGLPHRARALPGGGRPARGQRRPGAARHRPDPPQRHPGPPGHPDR